MWSRHLIEEFLWFVCAREMYFLVCPLFIKPLLIWRDLDIWYWMINKWHHKIIVILPHHQNTVIPNNKFGNKLNNSWTIVGDVFGECYTSYTYKTSCSFWKMSKIFGLPSSFFFQWQSKTVALLCAIQTLFLIILIIV